MTGGAGANPSAGQLADAIRATSSRQVVVLPNNPNVRLAAKQAGDLVPEVKVEVVPTRNAAEGIAAMFAFSAEAPLKKTAREMTAVSRRVQTLQVTAAVRDARIGRHKVKRDEFIVLGPDDGLVAFDRDRTTAVIAAVQKLKPGFELLTIYRGEGVNFATAEHLREALLTELADIEVELIDGGQPHYDFLIAAE